MSIFPRPFLLLAGMTLALAVSALAEDDRPRVGLVLGGGGARGAAHVGVIRVLEEQNIQVDYVTGTSMGSIVGALYALGLTADEIEQELLAVDWSELFEDRPDRRFRSMRRKEDDTATFFPIEFGLQGGWLATPRGLIAGQKFPFAFSDPGLVMAGHRTFDLLPIPYRAVATDLEKGERVVLDHGNLMRAVRASMSVPGIFPPVEIDGRLLVDGYLTSNVPVDAAREMGAEIVIAVDVERGLTDVAAEELATFGGIGEQAARIMSMLSVADELSRADVVIIPRVGQWNGTEYDQLAQIMPLGETAAREQIPDLRRYAVSPDEYAAWRARVTMHEYSEPVIDRVKLVNATRIDDAVILDRLDVAVGQPFSRDMLRKGFADVYELGLVERSDFDLDWSLDGEVLTVYVHEKPYAPYLVYLGGAYRLSDTGLSPITLNLRINKLEVNRRGAEWRTDVVMGSTVGVRSEFYQPVDFERRWFAAPYLLASVREDGLFFEDRDIGDYRFRQLLAGFDLGRTFGRLLEFRVGVYGGELKASGSTGILALFPETKARVAGPRAQLKIDTLDDHRVPHEGLLVGAQFASPQDWLSSDANYDRLWGQVLGARRIGRSSVILDLQGGTDLGSGMPFYENFYLGGLRSLSGYNIGRLRGNAFGVASLGWLQRLGGSDLPFAAKTYLGFWVDAGNAWEDSRDARLDDLIYSAAVSLLVETPLGPLHVGYGHSDDGHDAFHLDFGVHLSSPVN